MTKAETGDPSRARTMRVWMVHAPDIRTWDGPASGEYLMANERAAKALVRRLRKWIRLYGRPEDQDNVSYEEIEAHTTSQVGDWPFKGLEDIK